MITVNALIAVLYLGFGFVIACKGDEHEMMQHVPYGEIPAVIDLYTIRVLFYCIATLFGPLILLGFLSYFVVDAIRAKWRLWRAIRRLRKVGKVHPSLGTLVDETLEKYEHFKKQQ